MRRLVGSLLVAAVSVSGCGGGTKKSATSKTTTTTTAVDAPAPSTSAAPSPASTTTVTDVFPTLSLPCQAIPPPVTPVTSPSASASVFLVRVDEQGDRCVDHVVFSFRSKSADPPGYTITYGTPPFTADASGAPVPVRGSAFIVVKVKPGYGFDRDTGTTTYTGATRITPSGANHVAEIVQTGDFEGTLTWVVGLNEKRPFSVEATVKPQTQLAVTIS
jgi:hypothetical protein